MKDAYEPKLAILENDIDKLDCHFGNFLTRHSSGAEFPCKGSIMDELLPQLL